MSNMQPINNTVLLNYLIQNNTIQQLNPQISKFESRVYKYLMQGVSCASPNQLQQIEDSLPPSLTNPEKLQLLNCIPLSLPELYSCIFNAQERFSQEELLKILENIFTIINVD